MWNHVKPIVFCAATFTLAAGCATTTPAPSTEANPATALTAKAPSETGNPNKGKVVEVLQAGRYSYVNVDNGSVKTWFAIPTAEVKVGQHVEVKPGMEVKNYHAKSINRDFASIIFSDELLISEGNKPAAKKLPSYHPPIGQSAASTIAVQGIVRELITSSDYNYARVEQGHGDVWVAVPASEAIPSGEVVKFLPGQEVKNFGSNQLKRNFDRIIFSKGVDKEKK